MICGVNFVNLIYCRKNLSTLWQDIHRSAKHVAVNNGKLYAVDLKDNIFYKSNLLD